MDQDTYIAFIRRAQQAGSVAERHALADEALTTFPSALETERIRDLCQMYAVEMLAISRAEQRRRLAATASLGDRMRRAS